MWCFLLSHSQEAEGRVKGDWAWPSFFFSGRDYCGIQPWRCTASPNHPPPAGCDDIKPCFCLLVALACSVLLLAPVRRRRCTEGLWETWLDFRGRDYLGQSHLALVFLNTKRGQHDFLCFREKKLSSIFRFLFFSSIFRYLESVLHPHSYCSSLVFFHVLSHNPHMFYFFYKKQTAPMSTPNSWSAPPMSIGAMSTMGSLDVFWVLYSITVLAHWPVCFCKTAEKEKNVSGWILLQLFNKKKHSVFHSFSVIHFLTIASML